VAVDDASAYRLLDVGHLELPGRLGAQRRGVGHLQDEQLDRRHHDQRQDGHISGPMPEDERRAARPRLHDLAGASLSRWMTGRHRLSANIFVCLDLPPFPGLANVARLLRLPRLTQPLLLPDALGRRGGARTARRTG
jgi:predicted alpha/beta hydrolase